MTGRAGDADDEAGTSGFAELFQPDSRPPCQLYLISPAEVAGDFPARLEAALSAGAVAAFQLRLKGVDAETATRQAMPLQAVCRAHDVAFIINDDMQLAHRLRADGVHLGQGDGDPRAARQLLGREAQIGVTCHASRHLAMEAGEAGADYVAFGAFFPTATKQVEHFANADILSWWTALSPIPCVAIGGITAANCGPLVTAGADFLAVTGAVWNAADPAAAVRNLNSAILKSTGESAL